MILQRNTKNQRAMNNWAKFKRMQCNISKAKYNPQVTKLMEQHYQQLYQALVASKADEDIFNDTFLKITYKHNPDKDFVEQFKWLFQQLKGAYYRDDRCSHFYQLMEDRLSIPDFIPDSKPVVDTSIVDRLKALYSPIV